MRKFLGAVALCLLLTACGPQTPAVTPSHEITPAPDTVRSATAMPSACPPNEITSAPDTVRSETFRPNGYSEDVTVTVFYDPEQGQNRVEVTRNGALLQTILEDDGEWNCAQRSLTVEDMNFDGNLDFRFCYATMVGPNLLEHVYLYDYDYEMGGFSYRKAEELDGCTSLSFDQETAVVESWDRSARMGGWRLFKWTEDGAALRREARWERDFGGAEISYLVRDRSPGALPLAEEGEDETAWTRLARWESGTDAEPEDVLRPWLDVDYFGEQTPEAPTEIPQALLDFLTPLVAEDTWWAFSQQYAAGRALSYEETVERWKWAERSAVEGSSFDMAWGLALDADNDGQKDLFLHNVQGSGRFNYFYLLQGGEEVTEQGLLGDHTGPHWISWAGNRYLLVPWSNHYGTGELNGVNVWLFREGKGMERAYLERRTSSYSIMESRAETGYEEVLSDLAGRAAEIWADFDANLIQPVGTAEQAAEEEYTYRCDWNNDGVVETYRKFTRSSYPFIRHVALEMEGKPPTEPLYSWQAVEEGESLVLFWVEWNEKGNLIYTAVDGWGDAPVVFSVWHIREGEPREVASLVLASSHEVSVTYQGPDCDFDWY